MISEDALDEVLEVTSMILWRGISEIAGGLDRIGVACEEL